MDRSVRLAPADADTTEISVAEATTHHQGLWILMEVTEFDEHHNPSKGIVRFCHKSRKRITDESMKFRQPSEGATRPVYVFHSSPGDLSPLNLVAEAS